MVSIYGVYKVMDVMYPFVCGGGGPSGPAAAHTQRGARQWAKQWSIFPCPSSLPALWLATELQGGRGGMDRFCVRARAPTPPFENGRRPSYKSTPHTEPSSSNKAKATRHRMRTRTPTPGRGRDVRATSQRAHGPGSCTKRGGARDANGGDRVGLGG